jgi:mRNA-degrading endonuclease YafQ of YafQ-DinJ toxin-antitoxin module
MDFNTITLFGKKSFADLLKEIHTNSSNKEKEIRTLINNLKPLITSTSDAVIIVPLIKDYLDVSVKNDDLLIKMAGIVQRSINSSNNNDEVLLSESDREILFQSIQELDTKAKEEVHKNEFIS